MKPEQTFFTLDEAAERLNCTADDVLRYGAFHSLGMCATVPSAMVLEYIWRVSGDHSQSFQNSGLPVPASGFFRIRADELQIIKTRGSAIPKVLYPLDSVPGETKDLSTFFMVEEWRGEPLEIRKENLLIFTNELNRFHDEIMATAIQNDIAAKRMSREEKIPASLLGDSFSEEMRRQQTTLTKYLPLETWTPAQAAMLVSGLCPDDDCEEIPEWAKGLDGVPTAANDRRLIGARNVLRIWRSRENPPERVKPTDFIAWCKIKGFDTGWLRSIEQPEKVEQPPVPTAAPQRKGPGRPPKDKKIEDFLDELTVDAVAIAKTMTKPTVPSVIKKLMADLKWKEHGFSKRGFEKTVVASWWQKK